MASAAAPPYRSIRKHASATTVAGTTRSLRGGQSVEPGPARLRPRSTRHPPGRLPDPTGRAGKPPSKPGRPDAAPVGRAVRRQRRTDEACRRPAQAQREAETAEQRARQRQEEDGQAQAAVECSEGRTAGTRGTRHRAGPAAPRHGRTTAPYARRPGPRTSASRTGRGHCTAGTPCRGDGAGPGRTVGELCRTDGGCRAPGAVDVGPRRRGGPGVAAAEYRVLRVDQWW